MLLSEADVLSIEKAQEMLREKILSFFFEMATRASFKTRDPNKTFVSFTAAEMLLLLRQNGYYEKITEILNEQNSAIGIVRGINTEEEVENALESLVGKEVFSQKKIKWEITKLTWKKEKFYTCELV